MIVPDLSLPTPLYVFATVSSLSSALPVMKTSAPLATRAWVIMRPIPEPPPVTTAIEPSMAMSPTTMVAVADGDSNVRIATVRGGEGGEGKG